MPTPTPTPDKRQRHTTDRAWLHRLITKWTKNQRLLAENLWIVNIILLGSQRPDFWFLGILPATSEGPQRCATPRYTTVVKHLFNFIFQFIKTRAANFIKHLRPLVVVPRRRFFHINSWQNMVHLRYRIFTAIWHLMMMSLNYRLVIWKLVMNKLIYRIVFCMR